MGQDKVKLTDQERLDAPDARALQALTYDYDAESLGDLIAGGAGALSPILWTISDDGSDITCAPSVFSFATRERDLTRVQPSSPALSVAHAWKSVVYSFNPVDPNHINYPVDFNAARADGLASGWTTRPLVWARVIEVDSDTDTRRVWDVGTATEVPTPLFTRTRQRLEFAVGETEPSGDGWVPISRVWRWVNNGGLWQPDFHTVSVWDSPDLFDWTESVGEVYDQFTSKICAGSIVDRLVESASSFDSLRGLPSGYPPVEDKGGGLTTILHFLRRGVQRILAGGSEDPASGVIDFDWLGIPKLSLEGVRLALEALDPRVSAVETASSSNTASVANDRAASRVIASGTFIYDAGVGVAEGWYPQSGVGFTGATVKTGATWAEWTAKFALPPALETELRQYFISAVLTQLDDPAQFDGAGGAEITNLQLVSPLVPTMYAAPPNTYSPGTLISYYRGSPVGLPVGEYGIPFKLYGSKVSAPQLALLDPATLLAGASGAPRPAFHVTVFATKYLPGQTVA